MQQPGNGSAPPTDGVDPQSRRSTKDLSRAAVSGWLGTALEYFDFQLYAFGAALVFIPLFFPGTAPGIGFILAMATYGVGYVARLAGAVYFGRMGDRLGRKKVLFLTIALMGGSTTLIGFLPTYASVGILAPLLLVLLRMIGGFGAGAEIAGATVMLAEYAPRRRRGLVGSLVALGTNSGTLAAAGTWAVLLAVLSEEQLLDWGWRIPFIASVGLLLFTLWLRRNLKESPVFEQRADVVDGVAVKRDEITQVAGQAAVEQALHEKKGKAFFIAVGLRFGQAGNSGLIQTVLITYLVSTLMLDRSIGTTAITIGSVIGFATVPLVGILSDRIGRRPIYLVFSAIGAIIAVPLMLAVESGDTVLITVAIALSLNLAVLSLFAGESVTLAELFGARNRFTQLALAKEAGGIAASAIGPVLAAALTAATGSWWPLAAMMIGYSAIAFFSALVAPEVRGRDLLRLDNAA
ncbi:MFS transporter [Kineococcus gynurae]|uniref:MFS transporter n=1 Tax=Kineococcus gynurae TaxID=452979 RepID=A0ABV5LW62_9ACTN